MTSLYANDSTQLYIITFRLTDFISAEFPNNIRITSKLFPNSKVWVLSPFVRFSWKFVCNPMMAQSTDLERRCDYLNAFGLTFGFISERFVCNPHNNEVYERHFIND